MPIHQLESEIEAKARDRASQAGWYSRKFTAPSRRSVPDRIFIKSGRVVFIEFKQAGKTPTPAQQYQITLLEKAGAEVYVCDSIKSALVALGIE